MEITRRNALKIIGGDAGGRRARRSAKPRRRRRRRPQHARGRGAPGGGRRERPLQAEVLHRARIRDGHAAGRHDHPERRSLRQRQRCGRAAVHRLHDDRSARQARRRCAAACAGSTTSANLRFGKAFIDCADGRPDTAILDDIAFPHTRDARVHPGRRLLHGFRDLVATGLLHEPDGDPRPAATWATSPNQLGRLPGRVPGPPGAEGMSVRPRRDAIVAASPPGCSLHSTSPGPSGPTRPSWDRARCRGRP